MAKQTERVSAYIARDVNGRLVFCVQEGAGTGYYHINDIPIAPSISDIDKFKLKDISGDFRLEMRI